MCLLGKLRCSYALPACARHELEPCRILRWGSRAFVEGLWLAAHPRLFPLVGCADVRHEVPAIRPCRDVHG